MTNSALLIAGIISLVLSLGIFIWYLWALSYLFKRIGLPSWAGWVPVWNNWQLIERAALPGWIVLLSFVGLGIVPAIFLIIAIHRLNTEYGKGAGFTVLGVFIAPLWAMLLANHIDRTRGGGNRSLSYAQPQQAQPQYAPPVAPGAPAPVYPAPAPAQQPQTFLPPLPPTAAQGQAAPAPAPAPAAPMPPAAAPQAPVPPQAPRPSYAPPQPVSVVPPAPPAPNGGASLTSSKPWEEIIGQPAGPGSSPQTPAQNEPPRPFAWPADQDPTDSQSPVTLPPAPQQSAAPLPPAPPAPPAPAASAEPPAPHTEASIFDRAIADSDSLDLSDIEVQSKSSQNRDQEPTQNEPAQSAPAQSASAQSVPQAAAEEDLDRTVVVSRRARWGIELPDGEVLEIEDDDVVIGRKPAAVEESGVLQIKDPTRTLSKSHARLRREGEDWTIEDLDSTNGVALIDGDGEVISVVPGVPRAATQRLVIGTLEVKLIQL